MKKQESGRSMVEMLGVLAIIGVLSIGGIAGYTLSMRRFRVNNALDLVNKYALTTYSACQSKLLLGAYTATGTVASCTDSVPFSTSGLGGVPSGVTGINKPTFTATTDPTATTKKDASDRVDIAITFGEEELCKTAASITGGTVNGTGTTPPNNCVTSSKIFTFTVYMN